MAEKKQHKIISSETGEQVAQPHKTGGAAVKQAPATGNSAGLRVGAGVLWVMALGMEVLGVLILLGKVSFHFMPSLWQLIAVLVIDLVFVIIGAQLWKKANHIHPASEKNAFTFWLWNNMGVIVCVIAFVPFVILLLANKNTDKKTKAIVSVVAVIALLIGGVSSYDFNPVSVEQQEAAVSALGDTAVYWAPFGKVYHTHEDCPSLNQSDTLTTGTVDQAIAANRTRLCAFCAKADDISGLATDEAVADDVMAEPEAD